MAQREEVLMCAMRRGWRCVFDFYGREKMYRKGQKSSRERIQEHNKEEAEDKENNAPHTLGHGGRRRFDIAIEKISIQGNAVKFVSYLRTEHALSS